MLKYNLNDRPKKIEMLLFGLQWFSVILPFLIILAGIVSSLHTDDVAVKTIYFQKIFILTGVATIIQVMLGHRLPVVTGPATVLLIALVSNQAISANASYTAIAIGGALMVLLSYGRFFNYLQRVFTTRVVVVILMLVAITITPLIIKLSAGSSGSAGFNFMFAFALTLLMIFATLWLKGSSKSLVVLLSLIIGSVIYSSIFGVVGGSGGSEFSWSLMWSTLLITPEFQWPAIVSFFFCFLALTVNDFGAAQATGAYIGADSMADRTKKGVRATGFINIVSGMTGVIGFVGYSMSPGIISDSQSASRFPLIVSGGLLIACALFPQSMIIFSYIPEVVMGSILLYVMCTQFSSGLQLMVSGRAISTMHSAITISFPILIGIFISFAPESFKESIPGVLQPILGNAFIVGTLAVLLLEHTLNRKERQTRQNINK